jgi:hypothetical protein
MSIASKLIIEWNLPFMKDYVPPFHTSTKYGKMWKFADLITSICISEIKVKSKDRQRNGQKKKDKSTNTDLQNIHIKLNIE